MLSRRNFLHGLGWLTLGGNTVAAANAGGLLPRIGRERPRPVWAPDPARGWRGYSSVGLERLAGFDRTGAGHTPTTPGALMPWDRAGAELRATYPDLSRHFVFEYYPWYRRSPWRHWQQWHRRPPLDVAANSMPLLGPYDSQDTAVLEQHARWIRRSGAGAINLSWWGRDSYEDLLTHRVMDVMHAHDIKVAFHIEPYADDRGYRLADDLRYLLREYGERRSWDAFLVLEDGRGRQGPVFKSFRTILPETLTDCHDRVREVPDYTPDSVWARQTDSVRWLFRDDFDHVLLLADSLDMRRTRRSGFDGIAIYDNYVAADTFRAHGDRASEHRLLFSFNCNPGFDGIERRRVESDSCYEPPDFFPGERSLNFRRARDRERARRMAQRQIRRSLQATISAQLDRGSTDRRRGFFLVYVNSFNEWHEGHAFEPARSRNDLSPAERALGYHNPRQGDYRLKTLRRTLGRILGN